jgi:hypothetical protein
MRQSKNVICITLFSIFITTSCVNTRNTTSIESQYRDIYLQQFKLTYFRQLLTKSYNNSPAIREIIAGDHSGFTEQILTKADYNLIDSLTSIDNKRLIADSSEGSRRAEGANGKRPLGYIMEKLESKWLDSLAKSRLEIGGIPGQWSYNLY